MTEELVRLERRGRAAVLIINRPERMNSLSRATLAAFADAGRQLMPATDVRALVITAVGDRSFCAGADLAERRGMSEADVGEQLVAYRTDLGWLDRFHCPVVAAINGVALGGGLELALLCDLRVAAEHAELGLPETSLGIIPGAGGTQRLPRLVGDARAKELILLGRRLRAPEAERIGLVNRVTPSSRPVLDDCLEWIIPILEGAPLAQRAALTAIDAAADIPLAQGLELELALYESCLKSQDRREALAAFHEKRRPNFKGR
jgi:enoyl-CoA hydratase/carnithine racemase